MSDLGAILRDKRQAKKEGIQSLHKLADSLRSYGEADRIKKIGRKLLAEKELTPEALQRIQEDGGYSEEEMAKAFVTSGSFRQYINEENVQRMGDRPLTEKQLAEQVNWGIIKPFKNQREFFNYKKTRQETTGTLGKVVDKEGREQVYEQTPGAKSPKGTTPESIFNKKLGIKEGEGGSKRYKPENVTLWKDDKSLVVNNNDAEAMQKALAEGYREEGKEFAKDMVQYRNRKDNKVMNVNINDPKAITKARDNGFTPIGPSEKTFLEEEGKAGSKKLTEFNDDYGRAQEQIATLGVASHYLSQFESGRMAPTTEKVFGWAEALGVSTKGIDKELGAMQAFNAIAERMVLQSRNLGPGQVLAGQMSDRDVEFLRNMNIGLMKSPEGNKQLIEVLTRLATRRMEIADAANKFTETHGGVFNASKFRAHCKKQGFDKKNMFDNLTLPGTEKESNYDSAEEIRAAMRRNEISKEEANSRISQLGKNNE